MSMTEQTATVTEFPPMRPVSPDARPLRHRAYPSEPNLTSPAHAAWLVEEQLCTLWDELASPNELLATFAPAAAAMAADRLEELFDAADQVVEAREQTPRAVCSSYEAELRYSDRLADLMRVLRGVQAVAR